MITACLALGFLLVRSPVEPLRWPDVVAATFAHSRPITNSPAKVRAKPAAKKTSPPAPTTKRPSGVYLSSAHPYVMTPEEQAAWDEYNRRRVDVEVASRQAFTAGYLTAARQVLEGWLNAEPTDASVLPLLVDICFQQGDTSLAYQYLAPFTRSGQDPSVLLRSSVAAARLGLVFEGQREYCVAQVLRIWNDGQDTAACLPQGTSPQAVEAISALALGIRPSWSLAILRYYLDRALALDPGNPMACREIASFKARAHHYQAAVQLLDLGMQRASGPLLLSMRMNRDNYAYLHHLEGG